MIVSDDGGHVRPEGSGVAEVLVKALDESPVTYVLDPGRAGFDVRCTNSLAHGTNRARVKIFDLDPHTTVAFFYKDSQVPFSTDRFAYGALVWKQGGSLAVDAKSIVHFLENGLHPESRPANLKRAFSYTVPR